MAVELWILGGVVRKSQRKTPKSPDGSANSFHIKHCKISLLEQARHFLTPALQVAGRNRWFAVVTSCLLHIDEAKTMCVGGGLSIQPI